MSMRSIADSTSYHLFVTSLVPPFLQDDHFTNTLQVQTFSSCLGNKQNLRRTFVKSVDDLLAVWLLSFSADHTIADTILLQQLSYHLDTCTLKCRVHQCFFAI